ncbi:LamG-like jellyroll fold domain-containing protein [Paenibacillus turpanensis]|uniref:LamG-like jellyroll fold domain-containing protein n=1 Tax=Paenibacillus turpanensis TaxID=2689078 RepID=UPI001FB7399A|nr:LamG-like jellyroll fold domain-containing protein [Paenibacillus turpanensis]
MKKKMLSMAVLASLVFGSITPSFAAEPPAEPAQDAPAKPAVYAAEDLLLHYTFDQTEGTTVTDAAYQGKDGMLMGGGAWVPGRVGQALDLNGSDGYVKLPDGVLADQRSVTVAAWVNPESTPNWARVFDIGSSTDNYFFLALNDGTSVHMGLRSGSAVQSLSGAAFPSSDRWHHVAVTLEDKTAVIYINGIEVAKNTNLTITPADLGLSTANYIGKSQFNDPYYNGLIDDFRIYDRALSSDEVLEVIAENMTDEEAVAFASEWLDLKDTSEVTDYLALPSEGPLQTSITWASSHPAVIGTDGTVTRPQAGAGDATVTLTATIRKGAVAATETFEVTVWEQGAVAYTIHIDAANPAHEVSPTLYGLFYEDINYAGDGGLYAELVQNRSFEFGTPLYSWTEVRYGDAEGQVTAASEAPLNDKNHQYVQLQVTNPGDGFGIANSGYTGIALQQGEAYAFSVYARSSSGLSKPLRAELRGADETVYGACDISGITSDWKKFECTIESSATDPQAKLVVTAKDKAVVELDMVSLFPEKTWNNRKNGLRYDLAEMLDNMNPAFLRFPGGCIVEGGALDNHYRWKNTIGDIAERETQRNQWANNYYQSFGLGFHEYFQFSEDIGAEPLPIIYVGIISCNSNPPTVPLDELQPYIDHALDLIEYANGDAKTTEWGAVRAANGHPEPFNLKYLGVGNELWGEKYFERYKMFYDALKAEYPEIQLVFSAGAFPEDSAYRDAYNWLGPVGDGNEADLVDEHMYQSPEWMLNNVDRYDQFDRSGPKVFVGEYASHGVGKKNNVESALTEAAFMTGLERNSDIVAMAAYAPLFSRRPASFTQWTPDMIWFDEHRAFGTPNYYVQSMFMNHVGDQVLPMTLTKRNEDAVKGSILLGTWATQAEYDNIKVTANDGTVLYANDFSDPATLTDFASFNDNGRWTVEDGVLKQTYSDDDVRFLLQQGQQWTNYTLELDATKTGGNEGFLIGFGAQDPNNYYWFNLGGWNNTQTVIEKAVGGAKTTVSNVLSHSIETGKTYKVKIVVEGARIRAYLDGELLFDLNEGAYAGPLYSSTTIEEETGEIIVKVVNVSGNAQLSEVRVNGAEQIASEATVIELTGAALTDENSFEQPDHVSTVEKTASGFGPTFTYEFPAYSVTILRLRTTEAPLIQSMEQVNVGTKVGIAPNLPAHVKVTKTDGTTENAAVQWKPMDAEQWASRGVFEVEGTVAGTTLEAKALVTVTPQSSGGPNHDDDDDDDDDSGSSGDSGGSDSSSGGGSGTVQQPAAVKVVDGFAVVEWSSADFRSALQSASNGRLTIRAQTDAETNGFKLVVPAQALADAKSDGLQQIVIVSGHMTFTMTPDAFFSSENTAGNLELRVEQADVSGYSEQVQQRVGTRPVYKFHAQVNGSSVSKFNGMKAVKVELPYTQRPGELSSQIVVLHLAENGSMETIKNGVYHSASSTVAFYPSHFSVYAVGYAEVDFMDLERAPWAKQSIYGLAARGMVKGVGEARFEPDRNVTRAEFITMLMQAFDLTGESAGGNSRFSDVNANAWYADAITAAEKLGISKGKTDGSFGVNDPITRQEMAAMVDRLLKTQDQQWAAARTSVPPFADQSDFAAYAADDIQRLKAAEILNGLGDGRFGPSETTTRAQAAVVVFKAWMTQQK